MSVLLLDTHVWIWFINGSEALSKAIQKKINVAIQENKIGIAAISLWEISMLESKKRIILDMPCVEWINKSLKITHTFVFPLTPAIAVESCSLPDMFHEDSADRIITATARVEGLTLLTRDQRILEYSKKKYVSAIKV